MYNIKNFIENDDAKILAQEGIFTVIEYLRDLSVSSKSAQPAWFGKEMNMRKRQLICNLQQNSVILQAGAMQSMTGNIETETGVSGIGDFFGKAVHGSVTGESAVKPLYSGNGIIVTEPTYKHILFVDTAEWNSSVVLEDGLFLACDAELRCKTTARSNLSSAVAGGEGLFNLGISGNGILCLESPCPADEIVEITLKNDVLKADGNMVIAWSGSLDFSVEQSGKTLTGSAASGEGLVNVYRGTGKVWLAPVQNLG